MVTQGSYDVFECLFAFRKIVTRKRDVSGIKVTQEKRCEWENSNKEKSCEGNNGNTRREM